MAGGQLDGNTQTLNDTMFAVAAGDEQVIVVTNDNSTGNDAIICDESHHLDRGPRRARPSPPSRASSTTSCCCRASTPMGMTEDDIDFRGVLTDAAAAGFAGGEFDCVGVFAPFTLTALERPGLARLFSSADFPGTISDHIVVTPELIAERPDDVQALVDAWYDTLDYIEEQPRGGAGDPGRGGRAVRPRSTRASPRARRSSTPTTALAAFADGDDTTSLLFTARLINPFLVDVGPHRGGGRRSTGSSTRASPRTTSTEKGG